MFGFMEMFLNPAQSYENRVVGRWDSEDETAFVSTCSVTDGKKQFETGVAHPEYNDGKVIIVEGYATKALAKKGHAKWVKRMTSKKLPKSLFDCANSEVSSFVEDLGGNMEFKRQPKSQK